MKYLKNMVMAQKNSTFVGKPTTSQATLHGGKAEQEMVC